MDIFDILGPVMVGPSSSHTAGAARIGKMARTLLGGEPMEARIHLHGSFAETGSGHGTDRALVAGLLGLRPDDPRLPDSFALAEEAGSSKAVNIVLMGRLSHYFDLPEEAWQKSLEAMVPAKFLELNKKAFELGKNA